MRKEVEKQQKELHGEMIVVMNKKKKMEKEDEEKEVAKAERKQPKLRKLLLKPRQKRRRNDVGWHFNCRERYTMVEESNTGTRLAKVQQSLQRMHG